MEGTGQNARPVTGGVEYRIWAPRHQSVSVVTGSRAIDLEPCGNGFFFGLDVRGKAGDLYKFRLGDIGEFPDPSSHFQPQGVHGPSEVIDHSAFEWPESERAFERPSLAELIIYELHIGTFTADGTFRAAIDKLKHVRELGANAIEIMPVADFAGARNWGYDMVCLYAPSRNYGRPEDLKALVAAAHREGLAVILDVVYNHFGPDGNYLEQYSEDYFSADAANIWGKNINFDGRNSKFVRPFFINNAVHWMENYHVDGFRLDATHAIVDQSTPHVLTEIAREVRRRGGFTIAEDERNWNRLISPDGLEIDAGWADDFHHVVKVALTHEGFAHFMSYQGTPAELLDCVQNGWLFRGQVYAQTGKKRGTECVALPTEKFVYCISNHDQVGNRPLGERLNHLVSAEAYAAASALLCCLPYSPMLFMGQEFAASTPFCFFTNHAGEIGRNVSKGRLNEFKHYKANFSDETLARMPDPQDEKTFLDAKLKWNEVTQPDHARVLDLYKNFLRFRREHLTPERRARGHWKAELRDGAILAIDYGAYLVLCDLQGGHTARVSGYKGILSSANRANWDQLRFDKPETVVLQKQ